MLIMFSLYLPYISLYVKTIFSELKKTFLWILIYFIDFEPVTRCYLSLRGPGN